MNENGKVFVDTNVLVYAVDRMAGRKRAAAQAWLEALWNLDSGSISWQVLNEFYSVVLRKKHVSLADAREIVLSYQAWAPGAPDFDLLQRAWRWCDSAKLNFWDAMILASAEQDGCRWLLTEDLQIGRRFGNVTVINPFETEPSKIFPVK